MDKARIVTSEKTPFYVYDAHVILSQVSLLKSIFPSAKILYSIKANPFPPVVAYIAGQNIGADAASPAEVLLANDSNVQPGDIYYSSPGKTEENLSDVLGKCTIIADSCHELEMLNEIAQKRSLILKAGIRINPDFSMPAQRGASSKFGIDEESFEENAGFIRNLKNIKIIGIHVHVRSQVLLSSVLLDYYNNVYELALRMKQKYGFDMEFINFGGGLGIAYSEPAEKPLDYRRLLDGFAQLAKRNNEGLRARLIIESGRFLVCRAGAYVTKIVDIKISRGKKYIIIQNGLNGFLRPVLKELMAGAAAEEGFSAEPLFTSFHAFDFMVLTDETETETVDIAGSLCTAADTFATNITLPKAKIGDRVVVSNAGSYAYSLTPLLFSSHEVPRQFLANRP